MVLLGMFSGIELLIIMFIMAIIFLIPLIALIDIVRSKFEGDKKLKWVFIVLFMGFIGAIIYLIVGRDYKIKG